MSDDDGFDFGDEDESLFGSSDTTANDAGRRFGTGDEGDSSSPGRESSGVGTVATVVVAAVLVVAAGAVAYPLVMEAFDAGSPTDERAPDGSGGSTDVSTPTTPTDRPVTRIVVTIEETTTERSAATPRRTGAKPPTTATLTTTESSATHSTTSRTTVPVNEFPAGEPADEDGTTEA